MVMKKMRMVVSIIHVPIVDIKNMVMVVSKVHVRKKAVIVKAFTDLEPKQT